jgi:peptidoglycan/LPS O-acetylase OafA/YrhL
MIENRTFMTFQNKRLIGIVVIVALILLIPFVAMRFTNEVDWKLLDFTIMGVLLLGTGLLCELVLRTVKKTAYRVAICAVLLLALFLIWAELAVGLFGTRFAGS